eukprot:TRINITY_DN5610_c0_g1_i2.p1 TRINITY_DN5610_c0_g1~~TRINITY_DN5610_c0_g1_i2.p1  ORF type:complete len:626 (+),score=141.62 TRINITY_DN5610_c0_g1_i2:43-1920(+)
MDEWTHLSVDVERVTHDSLIISSNPSTVGDAIAWESRYNFKKYLRQENQHEIEFEEEIYDQTDDSSLHDRNDDLSFSPTNLASKVSLSHHEHELDADDHESHEIQHNDEHEQDAWLDEESQGHENTHDRYGDEHPRAKLLRAQAEKIQRLNREFADRAKSRNQQYSDVSNWIAEATKIQRKVLFFEKEQQSLFQYLRRELDREVIQLEEIDRKDREIRLGDDRIVVHSIRKIRDSVSRLKGLVMNPFQTNDYLRNVQHLMESIESEVIKFKQKQRLEYDRLLEEEKNTEKELMVFQQRLDRWDYEGGGMIDRAPKKSLSVQKAPVPEPSGDVNLWIKSIEKRIQQIGGKECGWDIRDHQTFLRLKAIFPDQDMFLQRAETAIPGKNRKDWEEHLDLFKHLESLLAEKRKALAEWKKQREEIKKKIVTIAQQNLEKPPSQQPKAADRIDYRLEQRVKLEIWKAAKLRELEEERALALEKEAKDNEAKKQREEKRKALTRQLLEEYKEDKTRQQQVEAILKNAQTIREKTPLSTAEMQRLQERDLKIVLERRSKSASRVASQRERQERLDDLKGKVPTPRVDRDFSRVLKPTLSVEHRKSDKTRESPSLVSIRQVQHLGVPSWRQGL